MTAFSVGMVGVGKLGLACAEVMAERYEVEGFDPSPVTPANFRMVRTLADACARKDIIFVAVPTPHDAAYGGASPSTHLAPRDFDYGIVKSVMTELNTCTKPHQLVALISTVLPGTARREIVPLAQNYRFVYNPYLIAVGSVKWDMVNPEMIIIGTEDGSLTGDAAQLMEFYAPLMCNNPRVVVGTWDEAESIKIFYNTFISAKVALVNMIQDVAERVGHINVDVVTDALKHSQRRIMGPAYMTAGMGDGGGCHPRDNIALRWLAQDLGLGYDLFEAIMASRERQAANMASRLLQLADEHGLKDIWIHGKSYKPGVSSTSGSYSLLVANYLSAAGRNAQFVDPCTGDARDAVYGVVLLAHQSQVTYANTPGAHPQLFYCEIKPRSVVVDPWRRVTEAMLPGCRIVHYGNTRLPRGTAAPAVSSFAGNATLARRKPP